MSEHTHAEFVHGCYRCELNLDELPGPHTCDAAVKDWAACELCGTVHRFCSACGRVADDCEEAS